MNRIASALPVIALLLSSCLQDRSFPNPIIEKPIDKQPEFTLVINEIMADGAPDWVEFYNYGDKEVTMKANEVFISDAINNPEKFVVDKDITVAPKGFVVLECLEAGAQPSSGISLHTDAFRLSAGGEAMSLKYIKDNSSVWADSLTFPAIRGNVSFARIPDGGSSFTISNNPTKGLPNKP